MLNPFIGYQQNRKKIQYFYKCSMFFITKKSLEMFFAQMFWWNEDIKNVLNRDKIWFIIAVITNQVFELKSMWNICLIKNKKITTYLIWWRILFLGVVQCTGVQIAFL